MSAQGVVCRERSRRDSSGPAAPAPAWYIFLDEGGNFDFSPNGTRYFVMTSVCEKRPFALHGDLTSLRFDLIEQGWDIEYFHASEDKQSVRNAVFDTVQPKAASLRIDSIIVEKRKAHPTVRSLDRFYPKMLGHLLRFVVKGLLRTGPAEIVVFTDRLPMRKKRRAVERATKVTLASMLPAGVRYRLLHHQSKSNPGLQIAD